VNQGIVEKEDKKKNSSKKAYKQHKEKGSVLIRIQPGFGGVWKT